jgi:hypothetical protein
MTSHHVTQTLFRDRMGALRLGSVGLLLAVSGSVFSAHGQEPSPLARVEALGLDTAHVGRVTVYFAPADRDRATELAALAEAAAFFDRELGISFNFSVAALASEHWFSEFPGVPYAIPWLSVTERLALTVQLLSGFDPVRWTLVGKDGAETPSSQRTERPARQLVAVGETYDLVLEPMLPLRVGLWPELRRGNGELLIQWPVRVR